MTFKCEGRREGVKEEVGYRNTLDVRSYNLPCCVVFFPGELLLFLSDTSSLEKEFSSPHGQCEL